MENTECVWGVWVKNIAGELDGKVVVVNFATTEFLTS